MSNSNKPILFFSRKNQECVQLWERLSKENRLNSFMKICVDNNNKIPASIRTVPTIFVKGRPLIYGPAINMYLSSLQSPGATQEPRSNNPVNEPSASNGINDFNPVEMSSRWSDSYSFIENNPQPMGFTFQFITDKNDKLAPSQPQQNNPNSQKSYKGMEMDNRLERLQRERSQMMQNINR